MRGPVQTRSMGTVTSALQHRKIHLDLATRLGHMHMGHEHNGWFSVAEPVGSYRGDDRTRDVEQWRKAGRNDPPWQPLLRCIYKCSVDWFIANGIAMAGPVGLTASKEGGDPGIEGNRISGRNVTRSSFTCQPSGEIARQSRHRMRPGQTVASRDWFLEWLQLDTRYDEKETPRLGDILWPRNFPVANEFSVLLNIRSTSADIAAFPVVTFNNSITPATPIAYVCKLICFEMCISPSLIRFEFRFMLNIRARKQGTDSWNQAFTKKEPKFAASDATSCLCYEGKIRPSSYSKQATSVTGHSMLEMTGLNKLREGIHPAFDGEKLYDSLSARKPDDLSSKCDWQNLGAYATPH
ncbi:hypothetical protein IW262DRAFT_1302267 [Armillaria fumosa]|nr:hypothetical protein IW262DRAFT_1302267 [Armillaria fumosa]